MKKGLLLSVVASGILFAGGDIAPVQPVVPAAAPAASDFWGLVALRYDAMKNQTGVNTWKGDSRSYIAAALGVEKELGYGFGFGAELDAAIRGNYKFKNKVERAGLSQLYITYKTGNTAVKFGRQVLPKAVSPWLWSDRTAGVAGLFDYTYNALTIVNNDIQDTTLVFGWVHSLYQNRVNTKIRGNKGALMLGAIYKGIANTTLSTSLYYVPSKGAQPKVISAWGAAETKLSNFDLGLQLAYAKANGSTKSFGVAGYIGTTYNNIDAKLTLAYLNDGSSSLVGAPGASSGFWGDTYAGVFGGDTIAGNKQKIARLDVGYKIPNYGKVYAGVAADKPDTGSTAVAARVGYDFTVKGVAAKIEYRYSKNFASQKNHRVRIQGVYKF